MQRLESMIGVAVLAILATACSTFGEAEPTKPAEGPGAKDEPTAPAADPKKDAPPPPMGTPPDSELTEKFGYFVAEKGNDESDGSRATPFATLGKALSKAKVDGKRVYVCAGTYPEALTLEDGVSMIGGYDCTRGEWMNAASGRARVTSPTSPAMRAKGIVSKTRFEGFDVIAPSATEPSASSFGFIAEGCTALVMVNTNIVAGRGASGLVGAQAIQLAPSGSFDGNDGEAAAFTGAMVSQPMPAPRPGVAGGTGACSGAAGHDGGQGGRGGAGAIWAVHPSGLSNDWFLESGLLGGEAKDGADGTDGNAGTSAQSVGTFTAQGFVTSDGVRGDDGEPGHGGAGGAGAGPTVEGYYQRGKWWYGSGGGSGGAGGCPGLAGGAGKGGGASVAVLLWNSPIEIQKSTVEAMNGGDGGRGSFASLPTAGGRGGALVNPGMPGGRGGRGGASGSGAGGSSYGLVHHGPAPKLTTTVAKIGRAGAGVAEMSHADGTTIPASADGEAKEVTSF